MLIFSPVLLALAKASLIDFIKKGKANELTSAK
jgi:hypothetical protein